MSDQHPGTEPLEPTDPAEQSDPTVPAERADPGKPPEPAEPTEPTEPTADPDLVPDQAASATDPPPANDHGTGLSRTRAIIGRGVQASVLIGVLFALLGFGLAVQVRTNSSTSGLATARQDDLVRILDDLSSREDRLRQQIASLQAARRDLSSSGDKASAALAEARVRSTTLGILAGTVAATGPGIRLTINDPGNRLDAEDLLDAVQELRAAGAEAFQVGPVRIGMSSAFTDRDGTVLLDGTPLDSPYVIIALGDPGTLATALNIPGGVVASVRNAGAEALVTQRDRLVVSALRPLTTPRYASPAPGPTGD